MWISFQGIQTFIELLIAPFKFYFKNYGSVFQYDPNTLKSGFQLNEVITSYIYKFILSTSGQHLAPQL